MNDPVMLLTGFAPFGGERINPSWEVARALEGERIAGHRVAARELPCCFGEAAAVLRAEIAARHPAAVLALGQAGGRCDFSIERVAINLDDARIPDNAGGQPIDTAIEPAGPAAYFASWPIKAMVAGLRAAGLPASVSNSAGTYVCNHVFYALMHALRGQPGVRAGFMHLPLLPEQAARLPGQPSLPLALMVQGVREALAVGLAHQGPDARRSEGRIA